MDGKFNDFSELKFLKMDFDGEASSGKEAAGHRASDGLRSGKKRHSGGQPGESLPEWKRKSLEMGLRPGCMVTLMDSSDRGVLRRVCDGYAEIEIDGLLLRAGFDEFVVSAPGEDESLLNSASSTAPKQERTVKSASSTIPNEITVDLHLEKIPSGRGVAAEAALSFQMEYFRRVLRENLRHRGMKITVVHGVGNGILKDAVRREIEERCALRCFWTPGPAGVTVVTVR